MGRLTNATPGEQRALRALGALAAATTLLAAPTVSADEPRSVTEPMVLREPAEVTNVVDAFDGEDSFDLNLTLGYSHTWKTSQIRRETHSAEGPFSSGLYTANNMNVGEYKESTSRLNTRADIGLYKDVALVVRLPVILSNSRELNAVDGSDAQQPLILQGQPGEQLFSLPFKSPTRSGIEYLAVGLDVGIMNQWRDPTKPTWIFGLEGRFSVTEPMHACRTNTAGLNVGAPATQVECADPSDINRNGVPGEISSNEPPGSNANDIQLEGSNFSKRSSGISRGTTMLVGHSHLSKRFRYIEPYSGFRAFFEFQNGSSDFGKSDLKGALVNHPPFGGTMVVGLNVIPWEIYDQFQRITLDFRATGTYRSEGRDYSELFDALGSSDASSLRHPNFSQYQPSATVVDATAAAQFPSVVNPNSQRVYVTGITDVQQHGIYTLSAALTWQAGEYVKFNFGGSSTWVQGHTITFDQPCNPDFAGAIEAAGPCRKDLGVDASATGVPNPNYRAVINAPGRRFWVDSGTEYEAWINGTVMF